MTTTPAMPEPFAWAWRNKVTGAKGVYFEDPKQFGITSHPDYEWTNLYTEAQALAALQSQPADVSDEPTEAQIAAGMRELFAGPKPWPSWEVTLKRVYQAMFALRPQAVPTLDLEAACIGYARLDGNEYKLASMRSNHVMGDGQLHPIYTFSDEVVEAHHGITAPAGGEKQA